MKTRALFLRAASMIAAALIGNTLARQAAAAPNLTGSSGVYRVRVGDFEVTALSDGALRSSTAKVGTDPPATPVNAYLVDTGKNLLLIDTGSGTLLGPGAGKLIENLRAAGYQPEQIDDIYITHIDPDHIGGLLFERKATFPHATVRVARAQADHWLARSSMTSAPVAERQVFAEVAAAFKPYAIAGRLKTFDEEADLSQGVRALPDAASGNTIYVVDSRGEKIVFWGDTLNGAAVTSRSQTVAIRFDPDTTAVVAQRNALLKDAAVHGSWVAAAHLSFPGLGHVRVAGHQFKFSPVSQPMP